MKRLQVRHGDRTISSNIGLADNFYTRLVGLMFRSSPPDCDGILLVPGNSIHTCFMRYSLDIVFLTAEDQVLKIVRDLRPWRQTWIYMRSRKVLELPAGRLPADVKEGDRLEVRNV